MRSEFYGLYLRSIIAWLVGFQVFGHMISTDLKLFWAREAWKRCKDSGCSLSFETTACWRRKLWDFHPSPHFLSNWYHCIPVATDLYVWTLQIMKTWYSESGMNLWGTQVTSKKPDIVSIICIQQFVILLSIQIPCKRNWIRTERIQRPCIIMLDLLLL